MSAIESRLDSLRLIYPKPKELKKRWTETLDEYEHTINLAIAYAARHVNDGKIAEPVKNPEPPKAKGPMHPELITAVDLTKKVFTGASVTDEMGETK
jgi:hypothetical protein